MNYCIVGNDPFTLKRELQKVLKSIDPNMDSMNITTYEAATTKISDVLDDCNMIPLFSNEKVVVLRNPTFLSSSGALSDKDQKMLLEYLEKPCVSTSLIFYGQIDLDGRKKLSGRIRKLCHFIRCDLPDAQQFVFEVRKQIQNRGLKMTPRATDELLLRLPVDRQLLDLTMEKCELYGSPLDIEEIRALVPRVAEDNVWELVQAVVEKNTHKALSITRDLFSLQQDAILLVASLASQFRLLYDVAVYLRMGKSQAEITSLLGKHPYRIQKAIESIRKTRFDLYQGLKILNALAKLDQSFKSGSLDKNSEFEIFLLKMNEER